MLRSIKDLHGYTIQATDGEMGEVYEFYFDDELWAVRYVVVETGNWLSGRRVLISPAVLGQPNAEEERLPVSLTRDQVRNSPEVDTDKPISRQKEQELNAYYGWPAYWTAGEGPAGHSQAIIGAYAQGPVLTEEEPEARAEPSSQDKTRLRSTRDVIGYYIQASDGDIGHVQDFVVDDEIWEIRYMVVDTRNWWPGKEVLVAPQWIEKVGWEEGKVHVDLTRESIRNSPEFDNLSAVNRDYENRLYEHYRRRKYWS